MPEANTGGAIRARVKAQGPHGRAARAEARAHAKMRRWYLDRTIDKLFDLLTRGTMCSCFPACRRSQVRQTLLALQAGLRRYQ